MNEVTEKPQETKEQPERSASKTKKFLQTTKGKGIAAAIVVVVLFAWVTSQVYSRPVTDDLVRRASAVIPYPAISVNGTTVSMKEFLIEYDALLQYFGGNSGETAPAADQLEVAIADTLVHKIVIEQLAKERGVELDQERVDAYYQDVLAGQPSEETFMQELEETFGWTTDEFKERIITSIVLALQMTEVILEDEELQAERAALAQQAYDRVMGGEAFAVVAKDIHSAFQGLESDLGYVNLSAVPESWSAEVGALETGQVSAVLDLPEGYAMFRLEDRVEGEEDTRLHLMTITVPKITLEVVVTEYLEEAEVKRYVGVE